MNQVAKICIAFVLGEVLTGCVTADPRTNQVRFTSNPAEVSTCTAVGNISVDDMNSFDPQISRGIAVGWSANVVLRTKTGGVAYRCGSEAVPGQ